MIIDEEDYLAHYGILRKSGRYPWGSGDNSAANRSFLADVEEMKRQGLTETEIARGFGVSTTQLRAAKSIAKAEEKQAQIGMAQRLKDKGYSNVAIGERMQLNESSVRALLAVGAEDKANILLATSNMLKDQVAEKRYVDIGAGVENHIGVSSTKLANAVAVLKEEGYTVHYVKVKQLGTSKDTTLKVLAAPDVPYSEIYQNRDNIKQVFGYSEDGGRSFFGLLPPLSIHPDRVAVKYGDEGGAEADGVMFIRPGVSDISLGRSRYAQVRVKVGDSHYLKGMAMYKEDLPAGVDILFNTNKKPTENKLDALKPLSDDPDNPFGAVVRQLKSPDGKTVTSAMNLVNEEGDWTKWSQSLSSQILSKQAPSLARKQLGQAFDRRQAELDEINSLTNPTVRKHLLMKFGDSADLAAVHLKAAALPRQGWHAILPIDSMPPSQIYAPNFRDGERVALVRYPHGGTFEIPELTVNNNHPEAKRFLGNAKDAVGIHHSVAERLSGADFDGDTVLVIPNNTGAIKSTPALDGLKGFDPKAAYPAYEGMKPISPKMKQTQMGVVSNLITDMTIHKAPPSEIVRAVRHSMVVIDAEKHNLNYRQSAIDNGIAQLKEKYQSGPRSGASTIISLASSNTRVLERKPRSAADGGPIDKATGEKVYVNTGASYVTPDGKTVYLTTKTTRLAEESDAYVLSSGTPMEKIYADYSNSVKALANSARKTAVNTPPSKYSPSAKQAYHKEVAQLNAALELAERNAPLERQAQILANAVVRSKVAANPNMEASVKKRTEAQALEEARTRTGARKQQIVITQGQWDAIQAGAISDSKLQKILINADLDTIRTLALPKEKRLMDSSNTARAKQMLNNGATRAEVADALGVSVSTLDASVSES